MFAKPKRLIIIFGLLCATAAPAQTITISPRNDAPAAVSAAITPPLRIQVSIQLSFPAGSGADEQRKLMESARRQIYESANTECVVLTEIFKAECRLISINANSSIMERGNIPPSINANGNASYELSPRAR